MYNGSPDRYDWKLVGKKEIYIPYNAYKLDDKSLKYKDIIQKGTDEVRLFRYELHRVWSVEARCARHEARVWPKRTFYLDEEPGRSPTRTRNDTAATSGASALPRDAVLRRDGCRSIGRPSGTTVERAS